MELVVPAGQDMATKADIAEAVSSMKEYGLRTLLIALTPLYLGMLGLSLGVAAISPSLIFLFASPAERGGKQEE